MYNVAIVGFGMAGKQFHGYLVEHCSRLKVHGIFVPREEVRVNLRKQLGNRVVMYEDFAAIMMDDKVDLVIIATPNDCHFEQTKTCLLGGKSVVVDKPVCLSVEELDELIALEEEVSKKYGRDVFCAAFHNRRLDGDFLSVKKLIEEQAIGDLLHLELSWQKYGVSTKDWKNANLSKGGGRFFDLGVHMADQLFQLVNSPISSVYAQMKFQNNVEVMTIASIEFKNGVTAVLDTSSITRVEKPRFYIVGSKATFQKFGVDPQEEKMLAKENISNLKDPSPGILESENGATVIESMPGQWLTFYENVADRLSNSSTSLIAGLQSLRVLYLFMEAAIESGRKKCLCKLSNSHSPQ